MAKNWWQVWIFNPYGTFNIKRQGRIDGKLGIPPWHSEQQPDFLRELYHLTQTTLESLVERWHHLDRTLKGAWVNATLRQQQAEKELVEAAEREEQAQRRHDEIHGRRLAVPDSRSRAFFYWLAVAVILICEFPLNAVVFQQLGVSYYETWLMTGGIAIAMVACAHFLGEQLHLPVDGRPKVIVNRILLAIVPFTAIVLVAMLRRDHMRQISNLDPAELLGTNLIINALIFWALTYYSYKLHDPVVEAVLVAITRRLIKEHQLHLAEKATATARINRQTSHREALQDANGWISEVRRRAALYRRTHLRARSDRDQQPTAVPEWFNREPALTIHEELTRLEWDIHPRLEVQEQAIPAMAFRATTR
ncbi:MAG: hypothetical protein J0H49_13545 [Acidobacteria bacterium]|nr:hypothetical protein [Acidobacteriota bacterium]